MTACEQLENSEGSDLFSTKQLHETLEILDKYDELFEYDTRTVFFD